MGPELVGFLVVAGLLVVTPGADTMFVLSRALRCGRGDALRGSCGVVAGLGVWAAASLVGLAALITASEMAYTVLRFAGAAYLLWLGATQAWRAWRPPSSGSQESVVVGRPFLTGLTTNLLNPKIGVFYLSVLPQLAPEGSTTGSAVLGGAVFHVTLSWCWLSGLAVVGSRARDRLRPLVRRRLEAISGGFLVAFGLRVATASR